MGGKILRKGDKVHCIEYGHGMKEWYYDGVLHRDDGPAVKLLSGGELWYRHGVRHRDGDLPAVVLTNGNRSWWKNGVWHRENGPAVEYGNGDKEWWLNGKKHREGGLPAVEYFDGRREWWIKGVKYDGHIREKKPDWMTGKTCVITLETITRDSQVGKCDVCNAVCLYDPLAEWLKSRKTCPHCRSPWKSYIKYV